MKNGPIGIYHFKAYKLIHSPMNPISAGKQLKTHKTISQIAVDSASVKYQFVTYHSLHKDHLNYNSATAFHMKLL